MTDNVIPRAEAIDRMKAGLPCETRVGQSTLYEWHGTKWSHFDVGYDTFRKPPEPRRVARMWSIPRGEQVMVQAGPDDLTIREVLPGDVVLQRMTEDETRAAFDAWVQENIPSPPTPRDLAFWFASRRDLGLIGEGS